MPRPIHLLLIATLVWAAIAIGALPSYADRGALAFDLDGKRQVVAIEGYGMRCAALWNATSSALGAAGSAAISCVPGPRPPWDGELNRPQAYGGHWRFVEAAR